MPSSKSCGGDCVGVRGPFVRRDMEHQKDLLEPWCGYFGTEKAGERVRDVNFTEDTISVDLFDGRTMLFFNL